ncbi:hypothetical protein [Salinifilum aidingensis]
MGRMRDEHLQGGKRAEADAAGERITGEQDAGQHGGGDPACWLALLCPECGAVAEQEPPTRCARCGAELPAG